MAISAGAFFRERKGQEKVRERRERERDGREREREREREGMADLRGKVEVYRRSLI